MIFSHYQSSLNVCLNTSAKCPASVFSLCFLQFIRFHRLFESQNNARGGYNVGENCPNGVIADPVTGLSTGRYEQYLLVCLHLQSCELTHLALPQSAGCTGTTADISQPNQQGSLKYFEGSQLYIEWTNQHGCGATQGKTYCQQVLQYMCWPGTDAAPASYEGDSTGLSDGTVSLLFFR